MMHNRAGGDRPYFVRFFAASRITASSHSRSVLPSIAAATFAARCASVPMYTWVFWASSAVTTVTLYHTPPGVVKW